MTRRKSYRPAGWQDQPTTWVWAVAYRRRKGSLRWDVTSTQVLSEASNAVRRAPYEKLGYREYGASKVFLRLWRGYREQITREEHEMKR